MHLTRTDPRVVSPGHFVALKFEEGWWFTQAISTSIQELKPWILLNENGNRAEIAAQTEGNLDEVKDAQGRRLVEPNDDERNLIFQLMFGVSPSRMQIYPRFGRDQNLGLEENMGPGLDEHWITGYDSPYNNPSEQSEVFYINDMDRLKLQAYNPMDEPEEARLSIFVNKLQYGTVKDVNTMNAILNGSITTKRHIMGLGVPERHQIKAPSWVNRNFGEHIMSTNEIIEQSDSDGAEDLMDPRNSAELRSTGG